MRHDSEADYSYGYLQHGEAGEPMRTEKRSVRTIGAGEWLCWYEGKWRKVYIQVNRTYIIYLNKRITILIDGV